MLWSFSDSVRSIGSITEELLTAQLPVSVSKCAAMSTPAFFGVIPYGLFFTLTAAVKVPVSLRDEITVVPTSEFSTAPVVTPSGFLIPDTLETSFSIVSTMVTWIALSRVS